MISFTSSGSAASNCVRLAVCKVLFGDFSIASATLSANWMVGDVGSMVFNGLCVIEYNDLF